jgi:hypothetical protein
LQLAGPEAIGIKAMQRFGDSFSAIFGKRPRAIADEAERAPLDLPADAEAEALNSLFTIYELLGERAVGFDQIDRSLKSCGWQDIESNALDERFTQYSAFSRLTRGEKLHRLAPDSGDIGSDLDREKATERSLFKENQYSGPRPRRFYSNRALAGSFLRLVGNKQDNALDFFSQLDAVLRYSHRRKVLDACKTVGIARHFVDYSQCSWRVEESSASGSNTVVGKKYYGGRDTMETWFVVNVLSDNFRNSDPWKALKLPEVFMSTSRNEARP